MLHATSQGGPGLFVSMLARVPGTLIVVGVVILGVVLVGYAVYFIFAKK